MLAVLKAGGAIVPMDPKHPIQRIQTIISLLGPNFARVVMTGASLADSLTQLDQPILQVSQHLLDAIIDTGVGPSGPALTTSAAAIIIFTSGSTGVPKGIVQEHKGYSSAAAYHGPPMAIDENARVFQFAAHTFDVSLSDILTTLTQGGCVCIPSEEDRMNNLAQAVRSLGANKLHLTPTVACLIDPKDVLPVVKVISLGGEPLSRQVLERWADHIHLIQGYGPAECGVDCTVRQHVQRDDPPNNLGFPVGSSIWIADPNNHDQLVPIGTEGELLVEGPIVARGYLASEELTAKSFIWDPEWVKLTRVRSGRRFYKTGDIGYQAPDGSIRIVGRNDSQIKLRGQRIEITEIEHQLRLVAGNEAVVAAVTPREGDKLLAAFVVAHGGDTDDGYDDDADDGLLTASPGKLARFREVIQQVKQTLQQNLPPYMLPAVYVPLRRLPLSLSGKIERKLLLALAADLTTEELAALTGSAEKMSKEFVAPSTHAEQVLAKAWGEVLNMEHIGATDDFFHLGGDSAKAMLLVSGIRKRGFTLTVMDVLTSPVLQAQATRLAEKVDLADVAPFSLVSGTPVDHKKLRHHIATVCCVAESRVLDAYPVTEMQARFFLGTFVGDASQAWLRDAQDSHDHTRQMVFKAPDTLDMDTFLKAWYAVSQVHVIMRTRFVRAGDQILQAVIGEDMPMNISYCSLDDYLQRDRAERMTWGSPLARVAVNKSARWVVITASHAIYDGISLSKTFDEVNHAYHQQGSPTKPKVSMNHFIKHHADSNRQTAMDFWRHELLDADVRPIMPHHTLQRKTEQNVVKKQTVRLVGTLATGAPNQAAMIQVSAALMLASRLGCGDIIFDCHLSGRTGTLPGVGDIAGPTLTSLPIRVSIGHDRSRYVHDIICQAHAKAGEVVEHEHIGWWPLVHSSEFRDKLIGAPLLNILPGAPGLGSELGLKQQKTIAFNEAPYGLMGTLVNANTIELLVFSDRDCVSEHDVEKQLRQWEVVLQRVYEACIKGSANGLTVGDVYALLSAHE